MNYLPFATSAIRQIWNISFRAIAHFFRVDGTQWAAAFAYNAFFSLFPLTVLLVAIASHFVDGGHATELVVAYMGQYLPIGIEMQKVVFEMISGVVRARATAGVTAFVVLIWVSSQCFATLIYVTNRAWKTKAHSWWRLPLKSFMILGVTAGVFFLGMILPVVAKLIGIGTYLIPIVVIFLGLCLFYKLAPRCPVRFSEVWRASLITTILLQATEKLFVIYLKDFAGLNVVYGAFGSGRGHLAGCDSLLEKE